MTDLMEYEDNHPPTSAASKTELQPIDRNDNPTLMRQFLDMLRSVVGRKPMYLALRFAEAEAAKREAEARRLDAEAEAVEIANQIKLIRAKQEFEAVQADIARRAELAEDAKLDRAVKRRTAKADARLQEAAARQVERLQLSREEAIKEVRRLVHKIRKAGGDVEIHGPEPESGA